MFEDDIQGTLMDIKKSDQTKLGFVVWFPFVRNHMGRIREGSLIAVKNFASTDEEDRYSVMRITSIMPRHYAMMAGKDGYPGFVEEAAMSASKDWEQDRPIEDTTKIECDAIPSTFEIRKPRLTGGEPAMARESNMPMPGERVRVLDIEWTRRIINHDLQKRTDEVITVGNLTNSKDVDILAIWDSMIRTHFGVFAYTNAGKSNLLSTVASKVSSKAGNSAKIVIYDLMGEYSALLIDVLSARADACVVFLSDRAVPRSVSAFWSDPTDKNLDTAANDIVKTTILPKMLATQREKFVGPIRKILREGKLKALAISGSESLSNLVSGIVDESTGQQSQAKSQFIAHVQRNTTTGSVTVQSITGLLKQIDDYSMPATSAAKAEELRKKLRRELESHRNRLRANESIHEKFKITIEQMTYNLNRSGTGALYIIQDGDDSEVRMFSRKLGNTMLDSRRRDGIISPPVSFVYDEADQFIAQDDRQPGMKESKQTAEQLARRGRKYGLGIGIATQRIVYLDTNILGQPHTYFVSKLPRASDREKIQEAFGLSDDTIQESLRFSAGQWLLISHSATGIDGLPIPVQLPDANDRISEFLAGFEDA